ncbi:MAG: LD-carboxypeptidase [Flavobacteriales bacterium]|nr:LD-carboxypeptidase [Flavobacteriales bacterium]
MKKIRIVSPAKQIEAQHLSFTVDFLTSKGFEVELGKHAAGQYHYFSGTDEERLFDFQQALDDESVDAILCSRGGYGSVRILDQLDFSAFLQKPKLIFGYSDITVFHHHVQAKYNLSSVHSTAPLNFSSNSKEALESLLNVLNGQPNQYEFQAHNLNRSGQTKAKVMGGNLAILYSLIGTDSDFDYDGKILFIEEIGEAVYAVDRMMWSLKKSGKLENLAALIVGGMTSMKDSQIPFGKTVEEVIAESVEEYSYPLCFNFPAGHIDDNRAIIFGKEAELRVSEISQFRQG